MCTSTSSATGQTSTAHKDLGRLVAQQLEISAPPEALWWRLRDELQQHPRLLLFDEVDAEHLAAALDELIGHLSGCPIVVTSSLSTLGRDWLLIHLTPLSPQDAVEMLMSAHGGGPRLAQAQAEEIASTVGYLPWALHEAARQWSHGATLPEIRSEFRNRRAQLRSRREPNG